MRARRTFSEKFKRQVVESVLSRSISQVELTMENRVLRQVIDLGEKEKKESLIITSRGYKMSKKDAK